LPWLGFRRLLSFHILIFFCKTAHGKNLAVMFIWKRRFKFLQMKLILHEEGLWWNLKGRN